MKGFARLVLKQRHKVTQKWPIHIHKFTNYNYIRSYSSTEQSLTYN